MLALIAVTPSLPEGRSWNVPLDQPRSKVLFRHKLLVQRRRVGYCRSLHYIPEMGERRCANENRQSAFYSHITDKRRTAQLERKNNRRPRLACAKRTLALGCPC